ncbi:MAG: hypothetical protein KGL39_26520 [Patescibacteria group bacterium]|nr:hypothetical protein [Patescibacteria group bacterium]
MSDLWESVKAAELKKSDTARATLGRSVVEGQVLHTYESAWGQKVVVLAAEGFYLGFKFFSPWVFERLVERRADVDPVVVEKAERPDWSTVMVAEVEKIAHDASLEALAGLVNAAGLEVLAAFDQDEINSTAFWVRVPNPRFGLGVVATFILGADGAFVSGHVDNLVEYMEPTTDLSVWFESLVQNWVQLKGVNQ